MTSIHLRSTAITLKSLLHLRPNDITFMTIKFRVNRWLNCNLRDTAKKIALHLPKRVLKEEEEKKQQQQPELQWNQYIE